MAERRMPEIVPRGDGFCKLFVKPQIFCYGVTHRLYVRNVFHSRTDVVVFYIVKHLRFVF